jgi:hypothetical protein
MKDSDNPGTNADNPGVLISKSTLETQRELLLNFLAHLRASLPFFGNSPGTIGRI